MIKEKHRILEIAICVIDKDGNLIDSFYSLVNPDDGFGNFEIDEEAIALNRIDIQECYKAPTLSELAPKLKELLEKNDLGGYNIEHFDIPFLIEQFHRIENPINLSSCNIIDNYKILTKAEPRKLVNMSQRFLGEVQTNAHSATNDVSTTYRITAKILNEFGLTHLNNKELHEFAFGTDTYFDSDKKLKKMLNSKNVVIDALFCFGKKYTDHRFSIVLQTDPGYIDWILKSDFSKDTKLWVQKLRKAFLNKQ
jgi:DNA polymerase-3 subunit epsilon